MKSNVLINADRLPLDSDNRKLVFASVGAITLTLTTILIFSLYFFSSQWFIPLSAGLTLYSLNVLYLKHIKSKICTGYIRNNMVILKMLSGKNFVMEFECIKKIESKQLLGFCYCKLNFKFDGVYYSSYVFGTIEGANCKEVFTEAREMYKKMKNKASHKPGSVHSAS